MKHFANVILCDNHLLVVDKPAGIATQPDLVLQAKAWVKEKYHKPGNVFLEPIHRLDKPVSGLVLFARTSKALGRLQEMMRLRQIKRVYHAWVEKVPSQPEGTLRHFLVHDTFKARVDKRGKEAILHYRLLQKNLLEVTLETGRYHQIRAQLAAIGSPLVGDQKYGSPTPLQSGIGLTHVYMEFLHPITQELIRLKSSISFLICDHVS